MNILILKDKEDLKNFAKKYLWPNSKYNKPTNYPCVIKTWDEFPLETGYHIEYSYLETLKAVVKALEEASNA